MAEICPDCGGRVCIEIQITSTFWTDIDPKTGEVKITFADVSPDKLVYEIVDSHCVECGRTGIDTDSGIEESDGTYFAHITEFGNDGE